jgi:hypothetical protein
MVAPTGPLCDATAVVAAQGGGAPRHGSEVGCGLDAVFHCDDQTHLHQRHGDDHRQADGRHRRHRGNAGLRMFHDSSTQVDVARSGHDKPGSGARDRPLTLTSTYPERWRATRNRTSSGRPGRIS